MILFLVMIWNGLKRLLPLIQVYTLPGRSELLAASCKGNEFETV